LDEWKQHLPEKDLKVVEVLSYGSAEKCVNETAHLVTENGWEGVMLNYAHAPYELKRTNTLLKVKKFQTADLRIVGYFAGKGALSGMLGGFIVDYKGRKVEVGSGFKKSERIEFWQNIDDYIGKIIEVQYFEETTNQKDNTVSLRFPTFKRLRLDKDEISYN
jgi:DNA ligase-1